MKTYTVKLRRFGTAARATATIIYRDSSWPAEVRWTGHRESFRMSRGQLMSLHATMDRLEETVAFQAKDAGAEFTIEDDGGEAPMREDNVLG